MPDQNSDPDHLPLAMTALDAVVGRDDNAWVCHLDGERFEVHFAATCESVFWLVIPDEECEMILAYEDARKSTTPMVMLGLRHLRNQIAHHIHVPQWRSHTGDFDT